MTTKITRGEVYRSRWQEARMIVDALAARIRYLRKRIADPATDEHDKAIYGRRLEQTDTELAEARAAESAAWTEIRAEEKAAAVAHAAHRFKEHR